jgi:hypothetical protein
MSWKQSLFWPYHRLKEQLGTYSHTGINSFEITYHLSIESKTANTITLAIPLPPTTPEQTITELKLHLPNTRQVTDEKCGNHFFIGSIEPRTAKLEIPAFSCQTTIRPYSKKNNCSTTGMPSIALTEDSNHLHPTDPRIQTLAKNIGQRSSRKEVASKINAHLVRTLVYGDPIDELYSDLDALLRPRVDCGGYDALFVSLCRANNIPARIVNGFFLDGTKNNMHAWAEFQDEKGHWIPVDPSMEQLAKKGRTKKSGRFGYIGSDRLQLSQGCDIPIEWNNKQYSAPLLQHPFILDGTGSESIRAALSVKMIPPQA